MQDHDVVPAPAGSTRASTSGRKTRTYRGRSVKRLRHRWRAIKRRTGGVDREAIQWLFATCGVIASGLGVAQFLWPDASAAVGGWWLVGTMASGVIGGLVLRVTKRSIRAVSSTGGWTIQVVQGSILGHRPCVITTDRRRTTSREKIAPDSLIGQLLESLDVTDRAAVELAIERTRSGTLSKPGDVQIIESSETAGPILLLACGRPTRNGTVTTWSHLTQTYDGLWAAIRSRHLDEVSVPVVGAGYSRVSLSHSAVLLALLLSFHAASTERPVCGLLRIVVPPTDADQEELVLVRRFLSALRYSLA
jgi:hypothetical protein